MHLEPRLFLCNATLQQRSSKWSSQGHENPHHLGICYKCKFSGPPSDLLNQKLEKVGSSNLSFNKPSMWFWYIIKFKIHCSRKWPSWDMINIHSYPQIFTICSPSSFSSGRLGLAWLLSPQVSVISLVIRVKAWEILLPLLPLYIAVSTSVPFSARSDISKRKCDIQIRSTCVPPSGQSGTWKAIYLLVQFSKSLVCCLESFPLVCGSGVSPGVHQQPYQVIFLSSSLSKISLVLSSSLRFSYLGQKAEALFTLRWREFPLTAPKSESKQQEDGRGEIDRGSPTF